MIKTREEIVADLPKIIQLSHDRNNESVAAILSACLSEITDLQAQLAQAKAGAKALESLEEICKLNLSCVTVKHNSSPLGHTWTLSHEGGYEEEPTLIEAIIAAKPKGATT